MIDLDPRFADSDMLGRFTPLDVTSVVRVGDRKLQVTTNSPSLIEHLASTMLAADLGQMPSTWKIVLQTPMGSFVLDPVILKKGSVFHVAFGTTGWMVVDRGREELIAFLLATPEEASQALATVGEILEGSPLGKGSNAES